MRFTAEVTALICQTVSALTVVSDSEPNEMSSPDSNTLWKLIALSSKSLLNTIYRPIAKPMRIMKAPPTRIPTGTLMRTTEVVIATAPRSCKVVDIIFLSKELGNRFFHCSP